MIFSVRKLKLSIIIRDQAMAASSRTKRHPDVVTSTSALIEAKLAIQIL